MKFDATAYGPEVAAIFRLAHGHPMDRLVASASPSAELKSRVHAGLFVDSAHPQAALSGLWLYFDCFEEAHTVSQEDHSAEGSLWHGIAHRREPDYGNANYWFQKAGNDHPAFPAIFEAVRALQGGGMKTPHWNPQFFTALCEAEEQAPDAYVLAIQRVEWEVLFEYCARKRSV